MGILNKMFGDGLKAKKPFIDRGSFPYNRKQQRSFQASVVITLIVLLSSWQYWVDGYKNGSDLEWWLNIGTVIVNGLFWYCVIYGVWTMVEKIRK